MSKSEEAVAPVYLKEMVVVHVYIGLRLSLTVSVRPMRLGGLAIGDGVAAQERIRQVKKILVRKVSRRKAQLDLTRRHREKCFGGGSGCELMIDSGCGERQVRMGRAR